MAALSLPPQNSHVGLDMPGSAPRFLSFPRSVTAPIGTHAVLRCRISGDPPPNVLWERVGNIRLELGDRCYAQRDGDWYQLVISDLRLEDSGHYMCRASNWSGEGYAGAKLTVTLNSTVFTEPRIGLPNDVVPATKLAEAPSSTLEPSVKTTQPLTPLDMTNDDRHSEGPDFPPCYLLLPRSQRLTRGESGEFTCKVSGKPEPQIRWEKDGRGLEEIFDRSHYHLSPGGHTLSISHVRPPDAGVYVCRATNSVGQCLAAAVLLVDPTPRQGPEPIPGDPPAQVKVFTVNEGKHAKLRCLVTGKPRPEIVWRKDGRTVSPGRRTLIYEDRDGHFILKILFCRQQDRGLYVCGASNSAGNTLSAVMLHVREVGDRFPAPLRDMAVREGQDAILECSVPEGTRTSWYLEDQRLHPGKRHLIEEHGTLRRLIIRGARTDDDGVYVCQTHRGAQSIAELAVRGPIVKKLPRRLEVAEGGNAAFCAETESEVEQVGWTRDGHILSEDHRTVVKSFGRTHVLVMVGVTQKDGGIIQFHAGLSESSCHLRVKVRGSSIAPASGEPSNRTQDAGQPLCLSCQTPSSGAKVRWMKDGQEVEAGGRFSLQSDGRMRRLLISSLDPLDSGTYTCHLGNDSTSFTVTVSEPPVKIINTSDNTEHKCVSGEPLVLSCEVSRENARVRWYRDGVEVEENENVRFELDGRHRRLVITGAKPEDAGEYGCNAGEDSVFFNVSISEPPVKIINTSDDTEHKCVSGEPLVLSCEVSRENARVRWYRDGVEVDESQNIRIESDGKHHRLVIACAKPEDSGEFVCDTGDDSVFYNVTVTEPLVKIVNTSDDGEHKSTSGESVVLSCEVSRENAPVHWYKDGAEIQETDNIRMESHGRERRLIISAARPEDSGEFVCDAGQDSVFYHVTVTDPPVKIVNTDDDAEHRHMSGERVVLSCEVSRENALVRWYKDGEELEKSENIVIEEEGRHRRLIIPSAQTQDSGEFMCDAGDDSIFYNVYVKDPPVQIVCASDTKALLSGERMELSCEVSRENAEVCWYKDDEELQESEKIILEADGRHRRLIMLSVQPSDSGEFVCDAIDDSAVFTVAVTDPPVKIINTDDDMEHKCVSGEPAVLSCEVSRENARVRWYRDGVEVEENENIRLESDGRHRRLVITCAKPEDSGEYVCDTGDDSVFYTVMVTEPPVKILNAEDDTDERCLSGEELVLSCELSRENVLVRWYKDGERLEESEKISLESEGRLRRLIILCAQTQDSGEFVCDAGDDSIFYNVTVTDPPVRIVNTSDNVEKRCLSGEEVILSCEVSRENAKVCWYKDGVEVEDSEDLVLESDGKYRRLIIHNAQVQDSGEFVCDARDDCVFYNVVVSEPPVKLLNTSDDTELMYLTGEQVELSCEVSRENASVRWYKDGEEVEEMEEIQLESDGKHRGLIIPFAQTQHSGDYTCDAGDDSICYYVKVTEPPVKFVNTSEDTELAYVNGEPVILSSEVSRENAHVRWYKDGVEVEDSEDVRVEADGRIRRLVIHSAQVEDSGEYVCDAGDDAVFYSVLVTEPPTKIVFPDVRSQELEYIVGARVELVLEVSRSGGNARWFKDGLEVDEDENLQVTSEGTRRCLILPRANVDDTGEYICDTDSDSITFDVKISEPPAKFVSAGCSPPVLHVTEGDPLSIQCELSRTPDVIRWFKNGTEVTPDGNLTMDDEGEECTLSLLCAQPEHSGEYECNVGTDTRTFQVQVDAPPVTIVGNTGTPEHHTLMTGDDLVLSCELSRPNFKVRWLRNGEELVSGGRVKITSRGVHRQLTIQSVRALDSGTYTCDAGTDQLQTEVRVEVPRQVEFITELQNVTVLEGDTATFKCVVSPEDVILHWELNGSPVNSDRRASMSSNGLCHSLTLHGCRLSDSGTIIANAEGLISRARLRVQEAHVMFSKGLKDMEVEEEQDVTFEVQVTTEKAEVHWVKQGVVIQPNDRFTLQDSGHSHTLTILGVQASDRGRYSCESLHDRSDCRLNVLPRSIGIKKGLKDVRCVEGSDVEFLVELTHDDLKGEWWKGGVPLTSDDRCVIKSNGRQHSLRLLDLSLPDTSVIAFITDTLRTMGQLTVTEHPLAITQAPQDCVVHEAGLATFQCEVSKQEAVVTWSKDAEELVPSTLCRMFSVGRRRILHINQCGPQDAGTYTCNVGDLSASATLRVLEQEPQVLKDLQDVEIVENDNAAFICELSCAQAKGEWFKNGEKIKVTSTTKIRQEGRRHFLLICGAQCEDSGEILFRARRVESRAKLKVKELPVRIVKSLRDKTALQGHRVIFECKVSPARAPVTWLRGSQVIVPSDKYQITSEDAYRTLYINDVGPEDEDVYTMKTPGGQTSARLLVEGLAIQLYKNLRDVKVTAPDDACFECEVSLPLSRPPQWSLNGVQLHNGGDIIIEARGNRHRLTLQDTYPEMSGTVRFTAGKTRAEAQLIVQEQ
ncbi:obscurin-like protein 1 [Hyla sarda]|uniref:obscurin-like protein 1 n=1 Tax=Hyla sarda TaxID=327740 RepID=UPI0024C3CC91|nr:obscurin-like protein 1 [Hyla sarda]XP_056391855.1 obscurin-like protein 1 [Hyla sarda]XP_056391856.1 obscurin-like protein 1 [Hyla sarda]